MTVCCPGWVGRNNPARTTNGHLKGITSTNCCIHTVVPPDDGPRYARNMYRLTKYTKNKLCINLVFIYNKLQEGSVAWLWLATQVNGVNDSNFLNRYHQQMHRYSNYTFTYNQLIFRHVSFFLGNPNGVLHQTSIHEAQMINETQMTIIYVSYMLVWGKTPWGWSKKIETRRNIIDCMWKCILVHLLVLSVKLFTKARTWTLKMLNDVGRKDGWNSETCLS
jgi:hypothetical protein